jgi:ferritin-like metal-binding protein YciE
MATHEHDLDDLFHRRLRQIWFAEKRIHAALPKMAKSAQSDGLRADFRNDRQVRQG